MTLFVVCVACVIIICCACKKLYLFKKPNSDNSTSKDSDISVLKNGGIADIESLNLLTKPSGGFGSASDPTKAETQDPPGKYERHHSIMAFCQYTS